MISGYVGEGLILVIHESVTWNVMFVEEVSRNSAYLDSKTLFGKNTTAAIRHTKTGRVESQQVTKSDPLVERLRNTSRYSKGYIPWGTGIRGCKKGSCSDTCTLYHRFLLVLVRFGVRRNSTPASPLVSRLDRGTNERTWTIILYVKYLGFVSVNGADCD